MSIRVGIRPMGRRLALPPVAPPPPPPPFILEYVFTEGTASPYDIMYDTIDGVGPVSIDTSGETIATAYPSRRKLVRTSDGTLYATYRKLDAGKYKIYVEKSEDNGATWTDATIISTYAGMASYDQTNPAIAVDSQDYLHVVWEGEATGFTPWRQIWYNKYTDSWAGPIRISTVAGMDVRGQYYPSIAVDSQDYLHVVWSGLATVDTHGQIYRREYIAAWQAPDRVSNIANAQYSPSIAVDSQDYLHVVWYGKNPAPPWNEDIWYSKYIASWSGPIRINTYAGMDENDQNCVTLAVDVNDHIHVVWFGKATGFTTYWQVWYALYDGSWQTPIRLSTYAGMESYTNANPSIAVDSQNYLHVVWSGKATGYTDFNKVWYREYTDSWQTIECLQPTGQNVFPNLRWSRWP